MFKNNPTIEILTLNNKTITDFAAERNYLIKKSKNEWLLFLDSDEKVSDELEAEINNTKYQKSNISGYYIKRKNYFLGDCVGNDKILRLVKKGAGEWYRGVHEVYRLKTGQAGNLKGPIIHYTADNLHVYINKIKVYTLMHAIENLKEDKKSNLLKIIFYPIAKFILTFLKSKNVVFSIMQSFHSFLAWSELWLKQQKYHY